MINNTAHWGGELSRNDRSHTTSIVGTNAICLTVSSSELVYTTGMLTTVGFSSASRAEEGFAFSLRGSPAKINSPYQQIAVLRVNKAHRPLYGHCLLIYFGCGYKNLLPFRAGLDRPFLVG